MDYVQIWAITLGILWGFYFLTATVIEVTSKIWRSYKPDRNMQQQAVSRQQYTVELIVAARTVAISALCNLIVFHLVSKTIYPNYAGAGLDDPWWKILIDFFIILIAYDAYFYWTHRAMHHKWLFKSFHLEHHLSRIPTSFSAMRMSIPEAFVQPTFFIVWAYFMPGNAVAFALAVVYTIITSFMGHSGFEWFAFNKSKFPLFGLLANVAHHDAHHGGVFNKNFAIHFTWWDRLMGTHNHYYEDNFAKFFSRGAVPNTAKQAE